MCGKCLLFHEYKSAFKICSENIRLPNQGTQTSDLELYAPQWMQGPTINELKRATTRDYNENFPVASCISENRYLAFKLWSITHERVIPKEDNKQLKNLCMVLWGCGLFNLRFE